MDYRVALCFILTLSACKTYPNLGSGDGGVSTVSFSDIKDKRYDKFNIKVVKESNGESIWDETYEQVGKVSKKIKYGKYIFSMTYLKADGSVFVDSASCSDEIKEKNHITLSKPKEAIAIQICYPEGGKEVEHEETSDVTIEPELSTE